MAPWALSTWRVEMEGAPKGKHVRPRLWWSYRFDRMQQLRRINQDHDPFSSLNFHPTLWVSWDFWVLNFSTVHWCPFCPFTTYSLQKQENMCVYIYIYIYFFYMKTRSLLGASHAILFYTWDLSRSLAVCIGLWTLYSNYKFFKK